jgi:hypothetical protein
MKVLKQPNSRSRLISFAGNFAVGSLEGRRLECPNCEIIFELEKTDSLINVLEKPQCGYSVDENSPVYLCECCKTRVTIRCPNMNCRCVFSFPTGGCNKR